jgi:hypothetical protein
MPSNEDDQDPELKHFLENCRRFMADFPTLWGEVGEVQPTESVEMTTDQLVAEAHAHREGQAYPTAEQLVRNLPLVLRALCDHLLEVHPNALDVAPRLASIIDAVENVQGGPVGSEGKLH